MIVARCTPHTLASAEGSSVISFIPDEVRRGSVPHKSLINANYACFFLSAFAQRTL